MKFRIYSLFFLKLCDHHSLAASSNIDETVNGFSAMRAPFNLCASNMRQPCSIIIVRGTSGMKNKLKENAPMGVCAALLATSFLAVGGITPALAQAIPETTEKDEPEEVIVVTGSRLEGVVSTSQTITIDKTEIDARGYNSVEDILSGLPQNFNSINSATTSLAGTGQPGSSVGNAQRFGGQSAANLRGLGENNVLVLVNGRRQASSASIEFESLGRVGAVNLSTIPFAAIERVEILLDGASSIYGSDAIGGVINFILKRDFSGFEISGRHEIGKNGGDSTTIDALFGTSWGTGNITVSGSWRREDPVSTAKAGFTTLDRSALGGVDGRQFGQPALIYLPSDDFNSIGQLALDDDGTTPLTAADLAGATGRLISPTATVDTVQPFFGAEGENWSTTATFEQHFGDRLRVYADAQLSKDRSLVIYPSVGYIYSFSLADDDYGRLLVIPTTNAFNDTGQDLLIEAVLERESLEGIAPESERMTSDLRYGGAVGFEYQISDTWSADISAAISRTETDYDNDYYLLNLRKLQELANSSDPAVAFNPFGNGTAQVDLTSVFDTESGPDSLDQNYVTSVKTLQATFKGELFDLPGGPVRTAVGGELRWESMTFSDRNVFGSGDTRGIFAVASPKRELAAAYAELSVPLVGQANDVPLIDSLEINLSGRYDSYSSKVTTPDTTIDNQYNEFSPMIGVAWYPIRGLKIRGNWSRAFRAPTITQVFQARRLSVTYSPFVAYNFILDDPFLPDGVTDPAAVAPPLELYNGSNNNLKGETSESWSVGAHWNFDFLDSAYISVNFNDITIRNQISGTYSIVRDPETWLAGGFGPNGPANSVERNSEGFITAINSIPFNINGTESQSLDLGAGFGVHTDVGRLFFDWSATHTIKTERDALGVVSRLNDTDIGLPSWAHTFTLRWDAEKYGAALTINHTGSYDNLAGTANILSFRSKRVNSRFVDENDLYDRVDSYTTVDLTGRYKFESLGAEISAGVIDLFNAEFPYYNNVSGAPFDLRHVDPRGRRVFVKLSKRF
ncbi:TonB-dependent receptor [Pacificimonas sp. WHA3]|uniref:TonB-dependent receptor n=1 Tax=Pacificimonas pallii TaxID=2827236 RepID=A0ABS6SEY7_9SPHN|nr:TonB-dependent receptor [Pacificimonas pallii]MBV7256974.1 TonB-dependent receptor [Pacificimonas pallii]